MTSIKKWSVEHENVYFVVAILPLAFLYNMIFAKHWTAIIPIGLVTVQLFATIMFLLIRTKWSK